MANRSNNSGSKPVPPALRTNGTATAVGRVTGLPYIGNTWEFIIHAFVPKGIPKGYLFALYGENTVSQPNMAGNMGIIKGYSGGLENKAYWNAYGAPGSQTINGRPMGVGKSNGRDIYRIKSTPTGGVECYLNGVLVNTEPVSPNNQWGNILTLGGYDTSTENHLPSYISYCKLTIGTTAIAEYTFADGTGKNVLNPGTYDIALENGAIIYPQPAGTTSSNGVIGPNITTYI